MKNIIHKLKRLIWSEAKIEVGEHEARLISARDQKIALYKEAFKRCMAMADAIGVPVTFAKLSNDTYSGFYYNDTKRIELNSDCHDPEFPTASTIFTLAHEICHALQDISGTYESMDYPDDMEKIKANPEMLETWKKEVLIFEPEADKFAQNFCEKLGLGWSTYAYGSYLRAKTMYSEEKYKNYIYNEVYNMGILIETPKDEVA